MQTLKRRLWDEVMERHPVLPPRGGALLVVGDVYPAEMLAGDLIVAHCGWGEVPARGLAYDRVLLVASQEMPDAELALAQVGGLMKRDGVLVIVAARGWPWGVAGTVWYGGLRMSAWRRLLRRTGWKLDYAATAGFGEGSLLRFMPFAGMVRVMIAKKDVKGGGLRVVEVKPVPKGKVATAAG